MAGFYQHVTVSTALGIGYGTAAYFGLHMDWPTCVIAGGITALAGMLPDLDAPTGHPVREILGFAAAIVPLLVLKRLNIGIGLIHSAGIEGQVQLTHELIIVLMAACYFGVRFGAGWLLARLAVHRGMFHSIPAALIVALATFLLCDARTPMLRLFVAGGSLLGFLSHLVMDEIWSVRLGGTGVGLKKSAGTAFKLFSGSIPATVTAYVLLLGLSYLVLQDPATGQVISQLAGRHGVPRMASEAVEHLKR